MYQDANDLDKAFNKELFIIRNDLYYQQLQMNIDKQPFLLRVDISYKPQHALSGDSYSLRLTKDGKLVGFIIDAMGKGISAALTSMGATRFLNYFIDEMEEDGVFDFETWTKKFMKFISKNVLDDEIVCIAMVELDIKRANLRYALCGMPALLAVNDKNEMIPIKSNNPPLSKYSEQMRVTTVSSASFVKVLCYSDGLNESQIASGENYNIQMRQDFLETSCIEAFNARVRENIGKGDDDITYVYFQKLLQQDDFQKITIQSRYDAMDEVLHTISAFLKEHKVSSKCNAEIILSFSELLLNALEHGNFGITKAQKNTLIAHDTFDDEMVRLEALYYEKPIEITYGIVMVGEQKMFEATITDDGNGFDVATLKNIVVAPESFNGRGFVIIRKLLDHFYFNTKGNAITIQKFLLTDS